jgi:hypothetical protein
VDDTSVDADLPFMAATPENAFRLTLIVLGSLLIFLCVRLAYLRARAHDRSRYPTMWTLVSLATYALIPTLSGFFRFSAPIVPWKGALYVVGLVTGFAGIWSAVDFGRLFRRTRRTEAGVRREKGPGT